MTNALKNLFAVKPKIVSIDNGKPGTDSIEDIKETYFQSGKKDSEQAGGSPYALKACLNHIYHEFKERCEKDQLQQSKDKAPFVAECEKQKTELSKRETAKILKKEKIEKIESEVKKLNDDISDASMNPQKFGIDSNRKPRAQFYIGLFILVILVIYILVFYASATYSAFFKQFDSTALGAAIFDANAVNKAFAEGWLEGVFIVTIPFTFMGLGYLVHMFSKEGRLGNVKVTALLIITFIFDSILAYQIEKKIYNIEKTHNSPDFNFFIAFQEPEFWVIIFAGFIVYIIWGLVFDFVMKEHENIDKIEQFRKSLKAKRESLSKEKKNLEKQIDGIDLEIPAIVGLIKELESKINGFFFPVKRYMIYHSEYMRGWIMFIASGLAISQEKKDDLMQKCHKVADQHCSDCDVDKVHSTIYQTTV